MNATLTLLSACAAASLGAVAIISLYADLYLRDRLRIRQRLQQQFPQAQKSAPQKSPLFRDLKLLHATTERQAQRDLWTRFKTCVEQSGLSCTPWQIISLALGGAAIVTGAVSLFTGKYIAALALGGIAFLAPFLAVKMCRERRRTMFCHQLPDAFDQMRRSIQAGQSFMTAMRQIAHEFPAPLADEFTMCCQQQDLGLSQGLALQELARRTNVMELQMFVVAVLVQRDLGGNLAEMLGNLAEVVRKRFRLASRVKALTGEGRMQATVLAMLPFIAGGMMLVLHYEYAQVLLDRPRLLLVLLISEVIGALWIRRIINFDY